MTEPSRPSSEKNADSSIDGHQINDEPRISHRDNADNDLQGAIVARYGAIGPFLSKLFEMGVEARGVERVPEDMRDNTHFWSNIFMWWSVNSVLTTISIGVLGPQLFFLPLPHAIATILCFGAIGTAATSFIATLGPKTGLRTMIITRFSSGYIGCTIYSILNILTQFVLVFFSGMLIIKRLYRLGFAVTCVILGGQTLVAVNPGTLPLVVGIIIVGVLSVIPCIIGYDLIHYYDRYAWIPLTVVMMFLWALGARAGFDISAQLEQEDRGRALSADVLTFGGIVYGSIAGWAPVAADYNCRMPANTSSKKIFLMTFIGLYLPICSVEILGAALASISDPAYTAALENGGTGGLVAQVLTPWKGGGKFVLVILALSVLTNNVVNTYSAGLSIQALGRPFAKVPRFFWTFVGFVFYTVAGVAGREHFSAILSNFLAILGYWTAWFMAIVLEEHFIFRRKGGRLGGYGLDDWDSPTRLPLGVAGILAACFGAAGAVVGMAEVWYTGPIGKKAGAVFGADLGFELAFGFSALVYPPLRWLEIHFTGR